MTRLSVHVSSHPPIPLRNRTIAHGSTSLGHHSTTTRPSKICRMCSATRFEKKHTFQSSAYLPLERHGIGSDEDSTRSPPAHKRHKSSASVTSPTRMSAQISFNQPPSTSDDTSAQPTTSTTPVNPRKRRASHNANSPPTALASASSGPQAALATAPSTIPDTAAKKKGRTNTPWTPEEEQKLQQMRGENKGWSEIAKSFPTRTEGSVKKHWYKDMHYAEFNEDEASMLREAIREYEANKWKTIGQKVGKPAKACEHYAREHFRSS